MNSLGSSTASIDAESKLKLKCHFRHDGSCRVVAVKAACHPARSAQCTGGRPAL